MIEEDDDAGAFFRSLGPAFLPLLPDDDDDVLVQAVLAGLREEESPFPLATLATARAVARVMATVRLRRLLDVVAALSDYGFLKNPTGGGYKDHLPHILQRLSEHGSVVIQHPFRLEDTMSLQSGPSARRVLLCCPDRAGAYPVVLYFLDEARGALARSDGTPAGDLPPALSSSSSSSSSTISSLDMFLQALLTACTIPFPKPVDRETLGTSILQFPLDWDEELSEHLRTVLSFRRSVLVGYPSLAWLQSKVNGGGIPVGGGACFDVDGRVPGAVLELQTQHNTVILHLLAGGGSGGGGDEGLPAGYPQLLSSYIRSGRSTAVDAGGDGWPWRCRPNIPVRTTPEGLLRQDCVPTPLQWSTLCELDRMYHTPNLRAHFGDVVVSKSGRNYLLSPWVPRALPVGPGVGRDLERVRFALLGHPTGSGKTLTTLMFLPGPGNTTLVIVPDAAVLAHWSAEVQKHTLLDTTSPADVFILRGPEDLHAFRTLRTLLPGGPRLVLATYAVFRSDRWDQTFLPTVQTLVLDDLHRMKEKSSVFSKLTVDRVTRPGFVLLLGAHLADVPYRMLKRLVFLNCPALWDNSNDGDDDVPGTHRTVMHFSHLLAPPPPVKVSSSDWTVDFVDAPPYLRELHDRLRDIHSRFQDLRSRHRGILRFFERACSLAAAASSSSANELPSLRDLDDILETRIVSSQLTLTSCDAGDTPLPPAFALRGDDCSLCMASFRQPCQLACRHVYCLPCLETLATMSSGRNCLCPQCRRPIPRCAQGRLCAAHPVSWSAPAPPSLPAPPSAAGAPKLDLLRRYLTLRAELTPGFRAVVLLVRGLPGQLLPFLQEDLGLRAGAAGLPGVSRTESRKQVDRFRRKVNDVLVCSAQTGKLLDYADTTHIVVADLCLEVGKVSETLVYAARSNPAVCIHFILHRRTLDEVLFHAARDPDNRPTTMFKLTRTTALVVELLAVDGNPFLEALEEKLGRALDVADYQILPEGRRHVRFLQTRSVTGRSAMFEYNTRRKTWNPIGGIG